MLTLLRVYSKESIECGNQAKNASDMFSAILVLGAGVNGSKPSNELQSRLNLAAHVWDKNNHLLVFISGGIISENDEPQAMFKYLNLKGIPKNSLRILKPSFNTRETLNSFVQIKRNLPPGKLLAISSPYHCFRIKMESRRQKIILSAVSDKDSPEFNHKYIRRIRLITEVLAITFYLLPHSFTKKTPTMFQILRHRIPKTLIRLGS